MKKESRLLTGWLSVWTALFVLSAAIAVPLLWRGFFALHIGPLRLCEETGLTREQILTAYNEMMDFCMGRTDVFSTGVLAFTESGKAHFADCRVLFLLDLRVLVISAAVLLLHLILRRRFRPARPLGRGFLFWGPAGLLGAFAVIGALCAVDFDRAFVTFHHLFFPGKDNWLFDPDKDQIIRILPEVFFRNAALCILSVLAVLCIACVAADFIKYRKSE